MFVVAVVARQRRDERVDIERIALAEEPRDIDTVERKGHELGWRDRVSVGVSWLRGWRSSLIRLHRLAELGLVEADADINDAAPIVHIVERVDRAANVQLSGLVVVGCRERLAEVLGLRARCAESRRDAATVARRKLHRLNGDLNPAASGSGTNANVPMAHATASR